MATIAGGKTQEPRAGSAQRGAEMAFAVFGLACAAILLYISLDLLLDGAITSLVTGNRLTAPALHKVTPRDSGEHGGQSGAA